MAKQQSKKNVSRPRRRKTPKRGGANKVRNMSGLDNKAQQLAHLLSDPCGAPVTTGLYPGEVGMVERFISENFIVGAANTAGFLAFHPATGWFEFSNNATSAGVSAATFQSTNAPGNSFLTTNAQKVRGLGACIQAVCSSLSITNITGEIAMGICSADTLALAGTVPVDTLFTTLQARSALTREIKEIKWFPGTFDSRFSTYVSGATYPTWLTSGADFSDTNIIVVAVRNVPLGTVINLRVTWVCEWTPKPNLGLVPNPNSSPGVNHLAVVHAMEEAHPSWWTNLGHTASNVFGAFANQAIRAIGASATNGLTSFLSAAPLLML